MDMQSRGDAEAFEHELRGALYRFDCPDPLALGEYLSDLLEPAERTEVAAHLVDCDDCRSELQTLRAFLAQPAPAVSEPILGRARRIVATLFTPRPGLAYSGLRGAPDPTTRVFEAGDITVSVASGQTSGSLIGLIVAGEPLTDREVRLVPREGAALTTVVDDVGNFFFEGAPAGLYALEIDLPDGILVVEELTVE
jgi:Putative zinc-finger